jgi:hypothetical protein
MKNTVAIVALASCITALCRAASPPPVPDTLLACRKLPADSERVRCYDAQIDKMSAAAASAAPVTQAPPTAPKAAPALAASAPPRNASTAAATAASTQPASTAATFGQETLPPTARASTSQQEEPALLSSITALRAVRPQLYAISLANGQVWRQTEASDIALFLHVGDDVRIAKGTLGSYRLSTASTGAKNWVRVTRLK